MWLLLLMLVASLPAAAAPPPPPAPDPLLALRQAIEQSHDESSLRTRLQGLASRVGFTLSEQEAREGRVSFDLELAVPLPARRLCEAMGWSSAYAISGDAHQESWELDLSSGAIDSRYGPRIGAHTPHVGAWAVSPSLDGRPPGPLPALSSGGSPAYDLATYEARVTGLEVELWVPGWQVSEAIEAPHTETAPTFALSTAVIQAWMEEHKGYGAPDYLDSPQTDMRVFAVWNIPTSGLNDTDYWVYCLEETMGWRLLTSSQFMPPEDQAYSAVVDPKRHELRFLGKGGETYHRVPVAGCKWTRR